MRELVKRKTAGEDLDEGVALPFVALMLVLLLGISAFAIDLGWLYLNGARLQRAADSAALAGVVYLPANPAGAGEYAVNGANANGWDIGTVNGDGIPGGGPDTLSWQQLEDNRMEVTLGASVRTFFLPVLGFTSFDITRRATAEYVKPVQIGSPYSSFGVGNDPSQGFWAAASGPYTALANGDAFLSACHWSYVLDECMAANMTNALNWGSNPGPNPGNNPRVYPNDLNNQGPTNSRHRPAGYYYGIELAEGTTQLQVELYDPAFRRRGQNSCSFAQTGDCDRLVWGPPLPAGTNTQGPTTHFQLYAPDETPLDPTDNPLISGCGESYAPAESDATPTGHNTWTPLCTISAGPGIYVLRVWTTGGSGSNHYAVRANTTGPQANVYGINDISIFANANDANLPLAKIEPVHAGKTLELRFFDPGEGSGNAFMTVQEPGGNPATCVWEARNHDNQLVASQSSPGGCQIQTTVDGEAVMNNTWLTVRIEVPGDYTCDPDALLDCWWHMHMQLNTPHDRTTWAARVIGNPVQLVPNQP